jgi:hypothetical protein
MNKVRKEVLLSEKTIEMLQHRANQLQWSLKKYMEETLIAEADRIEERKKRNAKYYKKDTPVR